MPMHPFPVSSLEIDVDLAVVQFRPLADWWANRIQWTEDDHEDLVQEGMLELVKTLRGYQRSQRPIQDIKSLASVCFSAAMKWWYRKSYVKESEKGEGDRCIEFVGIDQLKIPVDNMEVYFSQIYVDQYLSELERVCGSTAKEIVLNMIDPGEAIGAIALRRMERKKAEKSAGNKRVIGYGSVGRVQKQDLREIVGLDTKTFDVLMLDIKKFTQRFLCHDRRNLN